MHSCSVWFSLWLCSWAHMIVVNTLVKWFWKVNGSALWGKLCIWACNFLLVSVAFDARFGLVRMDNGLLFVLLQLLKGLDYEVGTWMQLCASPPPHVPCSVTVRRTPTAPVLACSLAEPGASVMTWSCKVSAEETWQMQSKKFCAATLNTEKTHLPSFFHLDKINYSF